MRYFSFFKIKASTDEYRYVPGTVRAHAQGRAQGRARAFVHVHVL